MDKVEYVVPADQQDAEGLFIGGGYHAYTITDDGTKVLSLPAGNTALQGLGFVPLATHTPTPDA